MMMARLLFVAAVLFMTGCGSGINLLPEPFTRERADGKIPVKTELIREQVLAQLAGMPEGEAKVARWQHIETDYHACRLSSKKAAGAAEAVFADCMANRGYVYMYRIDAEHLHNDIEFEIEKEYDKHPDAKQKAEEEWLAAKTKREEEQNRFVRQEELPDDGFNFNYLYGLAAAGGIAALASGGGGGGDGNNSPSSQPNTTPMPMMTMMMADPPPPPPRAEPSPLAVTSPQFGALHNAATDGSFRFMVFVLPREGRTDRGDDGRPLHLHRQQVNRYHIRNGFQASVNFLIEYPRAWALYKEGPSHFDREDGTGRARILSSGQVQVIVESRPDITRLDQLCEASWLSQFINGNFPGMICPVVELSYSPDMRRVVYVAMADGFNRGIGIGESAFSFSGRYDGNKRAAGFTYDLGGYALRTDYIRLPSKQDGEVWLDTFRFGVLRPINDEARFFAGVDSYRNAIFAIDANGDNMHRLGFAVGDGYAVRYEYRFNL